MSFEIGHYFNEVNHRICLYKGGFDVCCDILLFFQRWFQVQKKVARAVVNSRMMRCQSFGRFVTKGIQDALQYVDNITTYWRQANAIYSAAERGAVRAPI